MKFAFLPLAILLCTAGHCQITDPSMLIMQLPLGKPLDRDLPKCRLDAKPNVDFCGVLGQIKSKSLKNAELKVFGPSINTDKQLPSWVAYDLIYIKIDNIGNIASMRFKTKGADVISQTVDSISKRFGKPSYIDAKNGQIVLWDHPTANVAHGCSGFDYCSVTFDSPAEVARQAALRAKTSRPPATP